MLALRSKTIVLFLLFFFTTFIYANEKISLQLQWKYQFQFAGFLIAKEKGFYDEVGLDLEIKEWSHGVDMIQEVIDKKATFAIARPTAFIDQSTQEHIRFIGAIYQSSPLVLLTDKSRKIESLKDMKGKTLMSTGDLSTDASIASMMYSQGVDFKKLNTISPSFNVQDIIDGKTDLIASYISNEPYILKQLGGEPVVFDPKDYGFDFYNDIVITHTDTIQNNAQTVQKFWEATVKGWLYAFDHIEESARIIQQKYNSQNKSLEALIFEGKGLKPLAINGEQKFGSLSTVKMERIYDVYRLLGLTNYGEVNFKNLVYDPSKHTITLTQNEKKYLQDNVIKVGVSPWYPLTFYDESKENIDGIGIEILELLAKKLSMKVEYYPDLWSKLLKDFQDKKLDLLPTTYFTQEREKFGSFSIPYMETKEYLYVHEESEVKSFEDLGGKTLVMTRDYGAIESVRKKYPNIIIHEVDTLEESIKLVLNKQADALFNTQFSVEGFLMKNHIYKIKPLYQISFKASPLHYFSHKENRILLDILNKGINSLTQAEIEEIISHWVRKSSDSLLSLQERRYIQYNRAVKVCINPNWAPIEFEQDSSPQGITIDILKLIGEKTSLHFEFVKTTSWTQSQQFLKEKKCDLLPAAIKTDERQSYAQFTKPYLSYDLVMVTTSDKPLISDIEQIATQTIARKKGSGLISVIKEKYPEMPIIETYGYKEAFEKVQNKEAYFTIATLPVLSYYKNRYDFDDLQVAGYTKMKYNLRMVVRDDNPMLLKILDKSLGEISGEQKKLIEEKWTTKEMDSKIDYDLVVKVLVVSGIILLFFIYKQILLRKSIKEFEELINATMEGILILQNGVCIEVNESALSIVGYENKSDVIGKTVFDFIPKEFHQKVRENMKRAYSSPYEIKALRKDGSTVPLLARGRNIKNGTLRLVSFVDISTLKQQEQQLLQQSKLVSMGEMIGNIAHQWRQPLSVISTSASGIKIQKEYGILEDEFLYKACDAIDSNAQYLSQTIDDFRDFIKGDRIKKRFSIEELVDSFIHLIEASAKTHEIIIIKEIPNDFYIQGYENELKQCFMNIYNNSKDVLKEKNNLEKKVFIINVVKKDEKTFFTFTDNGGGIPEEIIHNIFDPYFTTKHKSQGTGLGLSMTYNLITQGMDGSIVASNTTFEYEKKKYKGAVFSIELG